MRSMWASTKGSLDGFADLVRGSTLAGTVIHRDGKIVHLRQIIHGRAGAVAIAMVAV